MISHAISLTTSKKLMISRAISLKTPKKWMISHAIFLKTPKKLMISHPISLKTPKKRKIPHATSLKIPKRLMIAHGISKSVHSNGHLPQCCKQYDDNIQIFRPQLLNLKKLTFKKSNESNIQFQLTSFLPHPLVR